MSNTILRRRPDAKIDWSNAILGIRIDQDVADSSASVEYIDDAIGLTPISINKNNGVCNYGDWAEIITEVFGARPCIIKNNAVNRYLNPDNYAQDIDGNAVTITTTGIDVMVEFTKCWYRYRSESNNRYLYFEVTKKDMSGEPGWVCTAFQAEVNNASNQYRNQFYYGVYPSYLYNNKFYSISGRSPEGYGNESYSGLKWNTVRYYCTSKGSGWQMETIFKRMYIIGLLMLVTKNRNSQLSVGNGFFPKQYVEEQRTGTLDKNGLFYGRSSVDRAVKCFGIENMWGGIQYGCDGILGPAISASSTYIKYKMYPAYDTRGTGYSLLNVSPHTVNNWDYGAMSKMKPYLNGSIILPIQGTSGSGNSYSDSWYGDMFSWYDTEYEGSYGQWDAYSCYVGGGGNRSVPKPSGILSMMMTSVSTDRSRFIRLIFCK